MFNFGACIEVFLIYFGVNYFNLICQSNDILDLLGSSDKCTYMYASWPLSAVGCVQCVVQTKYI